MLRSQGQAIQARNLSGLLLLIGVGGLASAVAALIALGAYRDLYLIALAIGVLSITLVTLQNWRTGFYLFLVWLLFEDLFRKFLGNNMFIYFGKDILVGITYLSFLVALKRRLEPRFRAPFGVPLALFFWWGLLQVFNPNSPSMLYGLVGVKLYFYYIPLMFVGYALLRSEMDLKQLLLTNMGLGGIIAALGIIQAIVGPSFLNPAMLAPELRELGLQYRAAPITGAVLYRPTSVFVSDGRFAWYLLLVWWLGMGAAAYLALRGIRRGRRIVFLGTATALAAIILSGSRGAIMYALGSALAMGSAFLWGASREWGGWHRIVRLTRGGLVAAGIVVLALVLMFPEAVGARWAFYSETLLPESPASELVVRAWDYPVKNFFLAFEHEHWAMGYGIGVNSLGVQYISSFLGERPPSVGVESGFGTLVVEMGILGLLLWVIWVWALLRSSWRVVKRLRGTPFFPLGFSIFWFAFLLLVPFTYGGMAPYQNFVFNAFLWLLVGILFRLPSWRSSAPQEQDR